MHGKCKLALVVRTATLKRKQNELSWFYFSARVVCTRVHASLQEIEMNRFQMYQVKNIYGF